MNETPLTDRAYWAAYPNGGDGWDFARTMELKNEKLLEALERLCNAKRPLDWPPTAEVAEAFAHAKAIIEATTRPHYFSPGCWCEPVQDEEEPSLWIHNEQRGP